VVSVDGDEERRGRREGLKSQTIKAKSEASEE
jgi:hypothetical protein